MTVKKPNPASFTKAQLAFRLARAEKRIIKLERELTKLRAEAIGKVRLVVPEPQRMPWEAALPNSFGDV